MIVVIGAVNAAGEGADTAPTGMVAGVARAAATAGARVEVVTRLGEDPVGDAVLLAFAAEGIGHVATLRDAAHATAATRSLVESADPDPSDEADEGERPWPAAGVPKLDAADVELALRYLTDYRVIVAVHPDGADVSAVIAEAASWANAHVMYVTLPDAPVPIGLPDDALVLAAANDAEGLAGLLGRYAAAVDGGDPPQVAFRATLGATA